MFYLFSVHFSLLFILLLFHPPHYSVPLHFLMIFKTLSTINAFKAPKTFDTSTDHWHLVTNIFSQYICFVLSLIHALFLLSVVQSAGSLLDEIFENHRAANRWLIAERLRVLEVIALNSHCFLQNLYCFVKLRIVSTAGALVVITVTHSTQTFCSEAI